MPSYETASSLARRYGCKPRDISDLFYGRILDESRCPVIQGRRLIPPDYIPVVEQVLRERGKLAMEAVA
ncbi:MAG: hypothetical protein Q8K78_09090 [Planctomycetaceae bacterium]|nr:hypothetical protein [Planctomycetaceae bacterium]